MCVLPCVSYLYGRLVGGVQEGIICTLIYMSKRFWVFVCNVDRLRLQVLLSSNTRVEWCRGGKRGINSILGSGRFSFTIKPFAKNLKNMTFTLAGLVIKTLHLVSCYNRLFFKK